MIHIFSFLLFLKLMVICSLKIEMSFFGCRRGNPLHLCLERYRKLNQLWLHHCILEEIAQSLDVVNVMFAIEWQMFWWRIQQSRGWRGGSSRRTHLSARRQGNTERYPRVEMWDTHGRAERWNKPIWPCLIFCCEFFDQPANIIIIKPSTCGNTFSVSVINFSKKVMLGLLFVLHHDFYLS